MPNTLHYIPGSPPARALMLTCRLLELDVTFRETNFPKKENVSDWFLKLNPRHCVPTLEYEGDVLWESRAAMKYLVDKYAKDDALYPKDLKKRFIVDRQLDYDLGHVFRAVTDFVNPQKFMLKEKNAQSEKALRAILNDLNQIPEIQENKYIAGDSFTLADISMVCTLTFLDCIHFDISEYSQLSAWVQRVKALMPFYDEVNQCWDEWIVFSESEAFQERMRARMRALGLS